MNTMEAFMMAEENQGNESRIFDWERAARLIRKHKPRIALAGLDEDWSYTSGTIWEDGNPIRDNYCYLKSVCATPVLYLDAERIPCWRMASQAPEWDECTLWPDSALNILKDGDEK